MTGPVDVHGILEGAGADPDAAEGTQALALAQVDAAVAELIAKMQQIERLSREASPELVDVPAMLGDIARAAIAKATGGAK